MDKDQEIERLVRDNREKDERIAILEQQVLSMPIALLTQFANQLPDPLQLPTLN